MLVVYGLLFWAICALFVLALLYAYGEQERTRSVEV